MEIDRGIYPMPAFVTLAVADLDRAVDWYVNGLDFVVLFTMPGGLLVHLRRWRYQDILLRPGKAPTGGEWTFSVRAEAEALPDLAERARALGGGAVEGPYDTAWNTTDLRLTDPDGYTLTYTALRARTNPAFTAMMKEQARIQGLT